MEKEIILNADQIRKMRQALGLKSVYPRQVHCVTNQNLYDAGTKSDADWAHLVKLDLATASQHFGRNYYCLTQLGVQQLGRIMGITIQMTTNKRICHTAAETK